MQSIDTSAAAFLAGLVTSVHCVGMCGPLSCSWAVSSKPGESSFLRDTGSGRVSVVPATMTNSELTDLFTAAQIPLRLSLAYTLRSTA